MPRSVPEWIGKTDDSVAPDSVARRVCERQGWVCACGCTRVMNWNTDRIDIDHTIPLIDGGENRESNLQGMLHEHHVAKTSAEATQRAEARKHQAKAFVRPPSKWQSAGFVKAAPQRTATTPPKPKGDFDILAKART